LKDWAVIMQPTALTPTNPWLAARDRSASAELDLFCFPFAGGGANFFRAWRDALAPAIAVRPVQLPAREARLREPAIAGLEPMIDALLEGLRGALGERPFAFFGHSMGTLLAYELTVRLREEGLTGPVALIVSGRMAPQWPWTLPPIHGLPDAEFIEGVRRFNGIPPAVLDHPELVELALPALRGDFSVCETYVYRHRPPLDCPITAYGGLADPESERQGLEAWRAQTTAGMNLRMFSGDHFFLETSRELFLQMLRRDLEPARRRIGGAQ
jgi:medium-chain acyl-[acyl-carrier-protein] hydrolase